MRTPSDDELAQTATATPASGAAAPAPARLGKYQLEGELGAGGMGVVHAAFDPDLERRVAIKLLKDSGGVASRARLLREARAMARLAHPNVVAVYEVGTIDGRDFVAMELMEGQSLAEWVRSGAPSQREILDAFVAAGHGLAAAHAEGLVHRDFKPHNVLRNKRGRIAVTDFGLAREVDAKLSITRPFNGPVDAIGTPNLPMLTATGAVVGTPAYMSPEQWDGGMIGPATDQFAYCVALWEALSGERPFRGETGDELRAAIAVGAPDASKVPRRFRAVLKKGLDPHPARRYASMEALLAAVGKARRPRVLPWLAVLVPAAIIGVLVAQVATHRDPPVAPAPGGTLLPLGDHDALVTSIRRQDDNEYAMPVATREQLLLNGAELFGSDATLVPAEADSRSRGYKLYTIKPRSLYAALGLENGDALVSIDNLALEPANFARIIQALHADDEATLDVIRNGKALRISIEFH